jgi:hypothetical protein
VAVGARRTCVQHTGDSALERLRAFLGEWSMEAVFPGAGPTGVGGRTVFEWLTGEKFSPLDFSQRFTGTFSDDGASIQRRWETSTDGSSWQHDFDLIYRKRA